VETVAGQRRQIVDASDAAIVQGLKCGMSLAEARMLCPGLMCIEHDPQGDRRMLEALGRWMNRFTPAVSIGSADDQEWAPAVLFLDVTGCEQLFGGINSILNQVKAALTRFGIPASLAAAPTPGAAWAFALTGNFQMWEGETPAEPKLHSTKTARREPRPPILIAEEHQLRIALAPLPLEALRIGAEMVATLRHVGLRTIGQLLDLPRGQLPVRFGPALLERLDQATGDKPEPLEYLAHETPIAARMKFESPVGALEAVWAILERLLDLVLADLTRRGRGARRLELTFEPDGGSGGAPVVECITLSRPTRDRATLIDLLRRKTEQRGSEQGFCQFTLDVSLHEKISDTQPVFFEGVGKSIGQIELDRLFDQLRVAFGDGSIVRPKLVESYLPERAWQLASEEQKGSPITTAPVRPLHLLATPTEIRVICEPSDDYRGLPRQFTWAGQTYHLTYAVGPERIAGEWWRGHHRTRDYYDVEDERGMRFWIFRVITRKSEETSSTRWFLQGRFG
jgi:protein ImuB